MSTPSFRAIDPATGEPLEPLFVEATAADVDAAVVAAAAAFDDYRRRTAAERADFLERIAAELEALGEELIARGHAETALPKRGG